MQRQAWSSFWSVLGGMLLLSFLLGVNKKARQPSHNLGGSLSEDKVNTGKVELKEPRER